MGAAPGSPAKSQDHRNTKSIGGFTIVPCRLGRYRPFVRGSRSQDVSGIVKLTIIRMRWSSTSMEALGFPPSSPVPGIELGSVYLLRSGSHQDPITMRTSLALLAPLLLLTACAKEESDDLPVSTPVYQDLKVLYDKPDNRTRAYATFRKSSSLGVRLQLTGGSSITFNNESYTTYTELDNYFYRWSEEGMVDGVFRYTKEGVGTFLNTISRADTNDINVPNGVVLSQLNGGQVFWSGRPLENGETVSAELKQGSTSSSSVNVSVTGTQSIQLPASLFTNLTTGTAELYLTRTRTMSIQQSDGSAGGRRIWEVEARGTVAIE